MSEKKRLYKRLKYDSSLLSLYKETSKKYKQQVAHYRNRKEKEVMSSNNKKLFYGHINRTFRSRTSIPPLHDSNNQIVIDPQDKANLLNDYFCSIFQKIDSSKLPVLPSFSHQFRSMPDFSISPYDVTLAIKKLKTSVCHTPDQIPALYFKQTLPNLSKPIAVLFNISLIQGKLPLQWKTAIVLPIHKKGHTNSPINYRPISLTSVLCRVMETIIHEKIISHLLNNTLLSSLQHGFLPKRSTLTQQLCFFNQLTVMMNNKEPSIAAYVDFSKAFDRICHVKLLYVLDHYRINDKIINWIADLLRDRNQQTLVDGRFSNKSMVTSGVPQGSVLGPLLFALYLESLLKTLSSNFTSSHIYAYADDLKILSNNVGEVQMALNVLHAWAAEWDFFIQPTKSEVIFFPKAKTDYALLQIDNKPLMCTESVRDLGIVLRNDFKWSNQIQQVTSKATRLVFTMLKSFKTLEPSFYVNLYKTHIRPIIEYNSSIWNPSLIKETQNIEKTQRKFTKYLCKKKLILNFLIILKVSQN